MFKELDVVCLLNDQKQANLRKNMLGTIVCCYTTPNLAYEVEFCDEKGETIASIILKENDIKLSNE